MQNFLTVGIPSQLGINFGARLLDALVEWKNYGTQPPHSYWSPNARRYHEPEIITSYCSSKLTSNKNGVKKVQDIFSQKCIIKD